MSEIFFIAPYTASDWWDITNNSIERMGNLIIDPEEYKKAIRDHWPQAQIQSGSDTTSPYFPLNWKLPSSRPSFSGLEGHLYSNLQVVSFGTGPKESFLEYILWHRTLIPLKYVLYLFNSSSVDSFVLEAGTTEQDIIDFTGIID